MALPHENYAAQVDPHSTTSTILGMGYETARYATWRNPWFLSRIGTSGWDPKGKGLMSWANRKSGGLVNRVLAPDAGQFYRMFDKGLRRKLRAADRAGGFHSGRFIKGAMARGAGMSEELLETALSEGMKVAVTEGQRRHAVTAKRMGLSPDQLTNLYSVDRGVATGAGRITGDRSKQLVEKAAGRYSAARVASGEAGKYATTMFGVGKLLRGANVAMWGYEVLNLAMGGVKAVAAVGTQARYAQHATFGSGIQDSYMASTMRQASLMDMYSSEFGHRRHIGNEARFLHS